MWQDSMAAEAGAVSEALLERARSLLPRRASTARGASVSARASCTGLAGTHRYRHPHRAMQFEDAVTLFSEMVDSFPLSVTDPRALKNPDKRASCHCRAPGGHALFTLADPGDHYRLGKTRSSRCASGVHRSWASISRSSSTSNS